MINFWVVCGLLTFLACLFVFIPVYRMIKRDDKKGDQSSHSSVSREQENVSIFKERLAELELEKSDNRISDVLFTQRKQELEIALLNDVSVEKVAQIPPQSSVSSAFTVGTFVFSFLFIVIFSFWMYQENGSKSLVDEYYAMNFDAQELDKAQELARQGDMSGLLNQLHEKLKSAPDNIEGWQLLARSAMNAQNYSLASEAYLQIISIFEKQGENAAPIYGLLAQAKYYESEGKFNSDVDATIQKALSLDENELNSLGLLAIDAFASQRLLEAKNLWLKILSVYPQHPAKASIEAGVQRVNAQLGIEESLPASESALVISASVAVSVSIDDSLKAKLEPSDTVFILAKQVTGSVSNPNIPLAVSRHRVDEFPLTVTLDDSMSMAPIAKLSMAETVMVVARISKSGNPIAQEGDFEAISSDIDPRKQKKIDLIIQTEVN
ncbi:MAG: cytochrome c-type biogenesis protein CcmH [Oleiphilaceae bacterium]|jgi:cytochrome c-type biogenesis protein CcmH